MPGSTVQCGSELALAQTPNWNGWGVGAKLLAWSGLNPSWPVSTTVKPQPGPGTPPSVEVGTLKVMKREIWFAEIEIVPTPLPCASTNFCPKPCTSSNLLQADPVAIA